MQSDVFGLLDSLPSASQKTAKKSEEHQFYKLIFCNIDEDIFSVLYSDVKSRPNSPINSMVSALILQSRKSWTYEQLFDSIRFHILVRLALGLDNLHEMPFSIATLFNFQNRLNDHFVKTGTNLLEQVFDSLTQKQLKALKLKTNIQRADSFLAASNIRSYSRLQLLIEMLIRLYRILSDEDKEKFQQQFNPYVEKTSGQYIYTLKGSDLPHELEKIGTLYHWISQNVTPQYQEHDIFQIFERVYAEHFTVVNQKVEVKNAYQLKSDSVQSPDDLDATYRQKDGKKSKGQSINVTETAHPDNPINLLNDIAVNPNNKDDCKVLNERIDKIVFQTPELDEIHFDGAFGSSDNDIKFEAYHIRAIQTAIRGPKPEVDLGIEHESEAEYIVSCPRQTVKSQVTRKRHKAVFDISICQQCPLHEKCPTLMQKNCRVYYFTHEDYLRKKRLKAIESIPLERRTLRNNVEATVNEFVCKLRKGKLKVRGVFKTAIFAYTMGISINFGRIYRLIQENPELAARLGLRLGQIVKELMARYSKILRSLLHPRLMNAHNSPIAEFLIVGF